MAEQIYTWRDGTYGDPELSMTLAQAQSASHPGPCDWDVDELMLVPEIAAQLAKLDHQKVRRCLAEYGAWDDKELDEYLDNLQRLVWIAAGDIAERPDEYLDNPPLALAFAFCDVLKEWLSPTQFAELVAASEQIGWNTGNCASHDHCDANEAMAEAFTRIMGREWHWSDDPDDKQSADDTDLVNAAWTLARKINFSIPKQ